MENVTKETKEEIEKEQKKEEEFQKKLENNKLKVMTTFKKIKTSNTDGIIPKIKHHKRSVNNSFKLLIGEEKEENNQNHFKVKKLKILQSSKSSFDMPYISKNVKNLSRKINFQVNKVKKSHEDLTALNALYLDNSFFLERKTISNSSLNIFDSNSQEKKNYEEAIRKKNLRNNFEFVSKNYHKQLNLAFLKYNPYIYSNNLKRLLQVSQAVRDDISRTKLEIEEDIQTMNETKKRTKIIHKIKTTKNSGNKSVEYLEPNLFKISKNKNFFDSTKNSGIGIGGNLRKRRFSFLPSLGTDKGPNNKKDIINRFGIGLKYNKKDSRKSLEIYDDKSDDDYKLYNISREIEKYIGDENIKEKIDNQVKDYNKYKYMSLFKNDEDSGFKPKDYYYLQKNKINGMFGDLYIKKLKDRVLEEENNLGNKLRMNKNDYFNKINIDMKTSLREFDDNMVKKKINLLDEKENQ